MTSSELREQAARAERLAWAISDHATTERLLRLCREFRQRAEEIEAGRIDELADRQKAAL